MKQYNLLRKFLHRVSMLPLTLLTLSRVNRLLIVILSYVIGTIGLWYIFPPTRNGVIAFLPIITTAWLFRYRGMFISLVLDGLIFQVSYFLFWQKLLPTGAFVEGGITGFATSLGLGLIVCWLRIAVDMVQVARKKVFAAEQERLLALQIEHQSKLAYEQQRKVNELKDQFLLNVSHELRTPLTVLAGSLELLGEYDEALVPEKRAHLLKEAVASQEELVELVNRVLDATSVVGEIPLAQSEAVSLLPLVQDVLDHLASSDVDAYTIHAEIPEQITVWADPQFLRQVLRNLLSNVFKYVPTQTEIRIEAAQANSYSLVYLSVQDFGAGIPVEELPLLFEKFVRLKRHLAGSTRGTGLGLYICRQLVEAMGGRIWVESSGQPGKGSRFCMTLPPYLPPSLT